jgi:hypothetical protein
MDLFAQFDQLAGTGKDAGKGGVHASKPEEKPEGDLILECTQHEMDRANYGLMFAVRPTEFSCSIAALSFAIVGAGKKEVEVHTSDRAWSESKMCPHSGAGSSAWQPVGRMILQEGQEQQLQRLVLNAPVVVEVDQIQCFYLYCASGSEYGEGVGFSSNADKLTTSDSYMQVLVVSYAVV